MKTEYTISLISKKEAKPLLEQYHYLTNISKGFKSGYNFGLFKNEILVGVCIYTGFPVPELSKSMFGLERTEQFGFFELSRLCLDPTIQSTEHNITSWFLSRTIKKLRKIVNVRAILSYADSDFHGGTIYRACNFKYCGLSDLKSDFWIKQEDGNFVKHTRGKVKGVVGEWRHRSRKHRFVLIYDKTLKLKWKEVNYTQCTEL